MFGFGDFTNVLLVAACLALQYFLSTRKNVVWGAILPVAFVGWRVYVMIATDANIYGELLIILIGLIVLSLEWSEGRKKQNINQQKELKKMKAHDLT